jgi:hypothetical protein
LILLDCCRAKPTGYGLLLQLPTMLDRLIGYNFMMLPKPIRMRFVISSSSSANTMSASREAISIVLLDGTY